MPIDFIEKPKIPAQYGYVLKTGQLETLLNENSIDIHISLQYWLPQVIGNIFEVFYWLPNDRIDYCRLYIRAGALLKNDIFNARKMMWETVLPEFVSWIKAIEELPENSPIFDSDLYFKAVFQNGEIYVSKYSKF